MPSLLLVEDNADFRTVFQRRFEQMGYHVLTAPDGVRGLQVVMDSSLDLIILDLNMPYRGGLETLRLIRSVKPAMKVLIVTAVMDEAAQAEARRLGVSEVIFKPVGIKDLAAAVKRALGQAAA
jgi:DNA-binding response OmpR family regulator